jgi:hypothetical protein
MSEPFSYAGLAKSPWEKLTNKMGGARLFLSVIMLVIKGISPPIAAQESNRNAPQAQNTEKNLSYVVRDTIEREIEAQANDWSLWCYRKLEKKDEQGRMFMTWQAKGAQIERLPG